MEVLYYFPLSEEPFPILSFAHDSKSPSSSFQVSWTLLWRKGEREEKHRGKAAGGALSPPLPSAAPKWPENSGRSSVSGEGRKKGRKLLGLQLESLFSLSPLSSPPHLMEGGEEERKFLEKKTLMRIAADVFLFFWSEILKRLLLSLSSPILLGSAITPSFLNLICESLFWLFFCPQLGTHCYVVGMQEILLSLWCLLAGIDGPCDEDVFPEGGCWRLIRGKLCSQISPLCV